MIERVISEANRGLRQIAAVLSPKPWESSLMGVNALGLDFDHPPQRAFSPELESDWRRALQEALRRLEVLKPAFIAARIPCDWPLASRTLESGGFHWIENYLVLRHELQSLPADHQPRRVRALRPGDEQPLSELAGTSFQFSRFHMDPQIPAAIANRSRAEWTLNGCRGRASRVFVAEEGGQPAGFLLALKKQTEGAPFMNLDLMAVAQPFRGRKIGYELVVEFLKYCREEACSHALVGTQAQNIPSLNLYINAGFRMHRSYNSYHLHIGDA